MRRVAMATAALIALGLALILCGVLAYTGRWERWAQRTGYANCAGFACLFFGAASVSAGALMAFPRDALPRELLFFISVPLLWCGVIGLWWMPAFLLPKWFRDGREERRKMERATSEAQKGWAVKELYLSSTESRRFSGVFRLEVLDKVSYGDPPRHALVVSCSPPIPGQGLGHPLGIEELVLVNRFEGDDLWDIEKFPVFVQICIADPQSARGFESIAWGEIYQSEEAATSHTMR